MKRLAAMPMIQVVLIIGTITTVGWIVWEGTLPLVITIVGGGLIALRGSVGDTE